MAPARKYRFTRKDPQVDEDYRKKREKNNEAVKKSRFKSKQRQQQIQSRIADLRQENEELESKVREKSGHVKLLKELFVDKCTKTSVKIDDEELKRLFEEDSDSDDEDGAPKEKRKRAKRSCDS